MFKGRFPEMRNIDYPHSQSRNRLSNYREKSPVEEFYKQTHKPAHGTCDSVSFVDDVYMLFNQQRLDRMTAAALNTWLESTSRYDSQLANLRSRMTDEQLGAFIKSRFIQSRSELLAWSGYLESQYPDLIPAPADPAPADPAPANPAPAPAE